MPNVQKGMMHNCALSCGFLRWRGCRPPHTPLLRAGGATAPRELPRMAPPARAGGAIREGLGVGGCFPDEERG
eukprot:6706080-Alexandrium_andersonii.AAC.1